MTEIAIPAQQPNGLATYQQSSIDRLEKWAQQAVAVRQMADSICSTSFAPQAYRGKPDEATAAILAGAELGLDPMASLRAFDSINGTPAPKAMTLRAVVQAAGHEISIVESDARRCIVAGRRKGSTDWQTCTWTIERAKEMPQYKSNPNWRTNAAAMLVARATAELCRWIASDAIMGMPYAAEEITDHTGAPATSATARVTAADIVGLAVEAAPAADPVPTVEAIDAAEALSRIRHATTQTDLDRIRDMCQAAGLRDQGVLEAWRRRSDELAAPVADPDELFPPA